MRVWKPGSEFHRSFVVHNTFYIRQWGAGLLQMAGDSLQLVPGGERFAENRIDVMLPFGEDKILLGTKTRGLFLYDGVSFRPFVTEADRFLAENQLYEGILLSNGAYVLSTLRGGVVMINRQGHLLHHLDKNTGLQDNTVWAVESDRQGGLWLALNNGLARVETPAPLSIFPENLGITSNIESFQRHRGRLYAAGGLGVYVLKSTPFPGSPPVFQAVSGIAAQTWSLLSTGAALLAAASDGVYRIAERAKRISDVAAFTLYRSPTDSSRVYIGLQDGLGMLQLVKGRWRYAGRFPGIPEEVRSIVEDESGMLWLGTQFQGVLRVRLPERLLEADLEKLKLSIERYDRAHQLPGGEVNVYRVKRRIVFGTAKGLRRFDPGSASFLPDSTFGEIPADTSYAIHRVVEDARGRVWIERGRQNDFSIGVLLPGKENGYTWDQTPLLRMADFLPVWTIYPDDGRGDVVWFGGTGGVLRYDGNIPKNYQLDFPALLRRVVVNGDSLIFGGTSPAARPGGMSPRLTYQNNALRFEYAAPAYDDPARNRYQYFLEGFDHTWSAWTDETKKDYTNLPARAAGYRFHVRAKNIYRQQSSEDIYAFTILPPWYQSWWFYSLVILSILVVVLVIIRYGMHLATKREQEKARLREAQIIRRKNTELKEKNDRLEELLHELNTAQTRLMRSETRFRSLARSANDAIIAADSAGKITLWNECARATFGYSEEEVLGKPVTMIMPARYHEAHQQGMSRFISTGQSHIVGHVVEMVGLRKDGSEFPLELTLASWETDEGKFVTGIVRDVTKRKQEQAELAETQQQLYQADKMASLGKLTAGIAHEINTPVGVINSNVDVVFRCIEKLEAEIEKSQHSGTPQNVEEQRKYLQILKKNNRTFMSATERVTKILRSLKNFIRMDEAEYQEADIHEGIDSTVTLLEKEIDDRIEVVKEYGEIPRIGCYPGELNQVFMNLLTNALHAIPGKGRITIQTFPEDGWVHIQITDSGVGIPPEQRKQLFAPGFKREGARVKMGMGLFTSFNIVQRHRGRIRVESEPGKGSTFTVSLPVNAENA
jgi:PAS domain S-box-containing protein